MQVSLYNITIFGTNSSDIPPHPPSIREPINPSQVDLDMQALDTPNFSSSGSPLFVINTAFDHDHEFNKKLGFPSTNKKICYCYTQKERSFVEIGMKCVFLEDFFKKRLAYSISLIFFSNIYPIDYLSTVLWGKNQRIQIY
jgi:hypothetical protein